MLVLVQFVAEQLKEFIALVLFGRAEKLQRETETFSFGHDLEQPDGKHHVVDGHGERAKNLKKFPKDSKVHFTFEKFLKPGQSEIDEKSVTLFFGYPLSTPSPVEFVIRVRQVLVLDLQNLTIIKNAQMIS